MDQDVLTVETATAADVPAAQALIDDARQWLRSRGIDQWQDPVPDAVLLRDAEQGSLFVVRQDEVVVAMVTVSDSDSETWGGGKQPGSVRESIGRRSDASWQSTRATIAGAGGRKGCRPRGDLRAA
jgi:hypothetical protein